MFEQKKLVEALVLALDGSDDVKQQVKNAYFKRTRRIIFLVSFTMPLPRMLLTLLPMPTLRIGKKLLLVLAHLQLTRLNITAKCQSWVIVS